MRLAHLLLFLTFVLSMFAAPHDALAAKTSPSPDFDEEPTRPSQMSPDDEGKRQSIDISPVPLLSASDRKTEYFYKFRRALTFRLGGAYDSQAASEGKSVLTLIGTQYLFFLKDLESYEVGADLTSNGNGVIHLARRYIFTRNEFRPYAKLGLGIRIVPSDQLATVLKYQHYQIRGAIGFEYLVWRNTSTRVEIETNAAMKGIQGALTWGAVIAW